MTFIQLPCTNHWQPFQTQFFLNNAERFNSALQHRSVGDIKIISTFAQELATFMCFFTTKVGQVNIRPPREAVFEIPSALPMTDQYKFIHSDSPKRYARIIQPHSKIMSCPTTMSPPPDNNILKLNVTIPTPFCFFVLEIFTIPLMKMPRSPRANSISFSRHAPLAKVLVRRWQVFLITL